MKSKRIKTYSLQDGCYQKDKVDNININIVIIFFIVFNHKSGCLVMAPSKYYVNWKGRNTLSDGDVDINLDKYFRKIPIFYRNNKLVAEDYYGVDNVNSCRKSQ